MKKHDNKHIIEKINAGLDKIRPYLQTDGGDISLIEVTDDLVVRVKLIGACHSCPWSIHTLRIGVEQSLRREVPDIKEVVNVSD